MPTVSQSSGSCLSSACSSSLSSKRGWHSNEYDGLEDERTG